MPPDDPSSPGLTIEQQQSSTRMPKTLVADQGSDHHLSLPHASELMVSLKEAGHQVPPDDPSSTAPTAKQQQNFTYVPETPQVTQKVNELVDIYSLTSGIAPHTIRCLVKKLYFDHAWREEETVKAFSECDAYAGHGQTAQKVVLARAGQQQSVRPNGCLVRGRPVMRERSGTHSYDIAFLQSHCGDCSDQHKWRFNRGLLQATFLGLIPGHDKDTYLLDCFLGGLTASHLCHNSPCSDPFHFTLESWAFNNSRNSCVFHGSCFGHGELPTCRLDLKWDKEVAGWESVMTRCVEEQTAVPQFAWRCSAGCSNGRLWTSTRHWRAGIGNCAGCEEGGHYIRVPSGIPGKSFIKKYVRK